VREDKEREIVVMEREKRDLEDALIRKETEVQEYAKRE
jgi:hypothetical protein